MEFANSFKLGYIFTEKALDIPGLKKINILDEYNFYCSRDLCFYYKESDNNTILLIGTALDIRDSKSTGEKVIDTLFESLLEGRLYDELDYISGRYALIYSLEGDFKALSDATGMRSIFYTADYNSISSHARLLQHYCAKDEQLSEVEVNKTLDSSGAKIPYKYGYPGYLTSIKDNFILLPNFEIDFQNKTVSRFYPRKSLLKDLDINDVIIETHRYMENQVSSIVLLGKKVYCSLTAGLDSRFTLTATRNFDAITYITYNYKDNVTHNSDLNYSNIISNSLGIKHQVLSIDENYLYDTTEYKKYSSILNKNIIYSTHSKKVSYAYFKEFGEDNILIRSNLYEIGRAFFHEKIGEKNIEKKEDTPEFWGGVFTYLYNKKLLKNKYVDLAFRDYAKYCVKKQLFNYDPIDMFYWEHRMGLWHSNVVAESDPVFETLVLCNARKILELFLSLTLTDRKNATLFHQSINQYLPELKNIPINKKVVDKYDTFDVNASLDGSTLTITVSCAEISVNREFAYYIYLNEQKIDTCWYSQNNILTYELKRPGKYRVRAFIRDGGTPIAKNSNNITYLGGVKDLPLEDVRYSLLPGKNNIVSGAYVFETFYKKGKNNKLVILFNGAVGDRSKAVLPGFQRNSWGTDIDDHVLNISDPTLYLDDELRLGWYFGTTDKPLVNDLGKVILELCSVLSIDMKDVVLYGSSGGGFAALNVSAYIGRGIKAVAINPQIYLDKYIAKSTVDRFYNVCVLDKTKPAISVSQLWLNSDLDAYGLIYQNKLDRHHYNVHFKPFLIELKTVENASNNRIRNIVFEDERGHVGETRKDFRFLIEQVRAMGV